MSEPVLIKKGSEIELKVESLAFGGMGLAKIDDFVVFVKNGIPGQRVNAFIYKKKKGFAEARVTKIIDDSPFVAESPFDEFSYLQIVCFLNTLSTHPELHIKNQAFQLL